MYHSPGIDAHYALSPAHTMASPASTEASAAHSLRRRSGRALGHAHAAGDPQAQHGRPRRDPTAKLPFLNLPHQNLEAGANLARNACGK